MKGRWLLANRDFLVRDLVRDYCTVYHALAAQRRRFELDGAVSYTALRDLLGEAMRKGVFWRLKDTAHLLFRNSANHGDVAPVDTPAPVAESSGPVGSTPPPDAACCPGTQAARAETEQIESLRRHARNILPGGTEGIKALEALIDWCIGYAFHECVKLKEDAFQNQHYANRLIQISRHDAVTAEMYNPLRGLGGQTAESSSRELSRISHVLSHGLRLLAQYLVVEKHNTHLARWLASEEHMAEQAFGAGYEILLDALYGPGHENLYLLAARDFLEAGRREPAIALLEDAHRRDLLRGPGQNMLCRLLNEGTSGICASCGKSAQFPCLPYLAPVEIDKV
ncbi:MULTISPECIES: hypothetical protein [Desulfovibrio]|uniref:Uncharacterized protein n=1 Tax=Desulfovibrio desulfuricans TaxID=876 RepID=A0AA94L1X4_DESDE|nr:MULTISPECIES: hypothetical protein [Desulfovibrio]ATD82549.1 hypothetical protein CNY67_15035 [Desulfovibrio sp. G11]SFW39881.1 hypothetical protein SAMN02910291_01137 [Desulfovibrio desulfuricans]SPD35348.1 Hypothetical protein DSVG11_1245 [Desulfovibrio sp. G11]